MAEAIIRPSLKGIVEECVRRMSTASHIFDRYWPSVTDEQPALFMIHLLAAHVVKRSSDAACSS